MKLLSLLKSASGEASLGSALGRWRQAVTNVIDAMAPKYVITSLTGAPQAIPDLSVSTPIILDTISADGGVPYNTATGVYSLEANSLYELAFYGLFQVFGTEANDFTTVNWQDSQGNVLVPDVFSVHLPLTTTQNIGTQTTARILYRTTEAIDVRIMSQDGSGSASVGSSYAIVRKLGRA